jgi:hypothetical protein
MGLPTALFLFELSLPFRFDLEHSFKRASNGPFDSAQKTAKFGPAVAERVNSEYRWLEWEHQMRRRGFRRCQCLTSDRNLENSTISLSIPVRLVRTAASFAEVRSIPLSSCETALSAQATLLEAVSVSR